MNPQQQSNLFVKHPGFHPSGSDPLASPSPPVAIRRASPPSSPTLLYIAEAGLVSVHAEGTRTMWRLRVNIRGVMFPPVPRTSGLQVSCVLAKRIASIHWSSVKGICWLVS